jgi:uncharacterized protein DUF3313
MRGSYWTVLASGLVLLAGCATTKVTEVKGTSSGFLGKDYALLTPGDTAQGQAGLRYYDPAAQWRTYTKVMIDPVTFWGDDAGKVSAADQQELSTYFTGALTKAFSEKFEAVTAPGPGVLRVQVAIVDAESSTPGLRTVSLVLPQARLLTAAGSAAAGKQLFAGTLQVEGKVIDAATGKLLSASIARAVGGTNPSAAAQSTWGDAQNAMDLFSARAAENFHALTTGAATPEQLPLKKK